MKEDVNPKLVKNLYNKYAPNVNVDEKLSYIQDKYGDDEELFVRNFYNKYAPNVNVEEKLEYIKKNYSLKKKDESQPTSQKETTESVTKEKTEPTGSSESSVPKSPEFKSLSPQDKTPGERKASRPTKDSINPITEKPYNINNMMEAASLKAAQQEWDKKYSFPLAKDSKVEQLNKSQQKINEIESDKKDALSNIEKDTKEYEETQKSFDQSLDESYKQLENLQTTSTFNYIQDPETKLWSEREQEIEEKKSKFPLLSTQELSQKMLAGEIPVPQWALELTGQAVEDSKVPVIDERLFTTSLPEEIMVPAIQASFLKTNPQLLQDFVFKQTGFGNYLEVTTKDGLNTMSFELNQGDEEKAKQDANRLRRFLIDNQPSEKRNKVSEASRTISELQTKRYKTAREKILESNQEFNIDPRLLPIIDETGGLGTYQNTAIIPEWQLKREDKKKLEDAREILMTDAYDKAKNYSKELKDIRENYKNNSENISYEEYQKDIDDVKDKYRASIGTRVQSLEGQIQEAIALSLNDNNNNLQRIDKKNKELKEQQDFIINSISQNNGRISPEIKDAIIKLEFDRAVLEQDAIQGTMTNGELNVINNEINKSISNIALLKEAEGDKGGIIVNEFLGGASTFLRMLGLSESDVSQVIKVLGDPTTTEEFMTSSDRTFTDKLLGVLANMGGIISTAALTGPASPYTSAVGFMAQGYFGLGDEIDANPEFDNVPEFQKEILKLTFGGVSGLLEQFGVTKAFSKSPLGKKLSLRILRDVLKTVPKNVTIKNLEAAILSRVKSMVVNGGLQSIGAGFIEGSTELAQGGFEIGLKETFDAIKGKDFFKQDLSVDEIVGNLTEQFLLGFVAGGTTNIVTQSPRIANQGLKINKIDNSFAKILRDVSGDATFNSAITNHLKVKILKGELNYDEGVEILNSYKDVMGTMTKIPSETNNVVEAFDLLNEKSNIEKSIKGKSEELTKPQRERITQINEELETLATQPVEEEVTEEVFEETPVEEEVTEEDIIVTDPTKGYTFEYVSEEDIPTALQGIEPISRTEITSGKTKKDATKSIRLTFSGQQLLDAGIGKPPSDLETTEVTEEVVEEAPADPKLQERLTKRITRIKTDLDKATTPEEKAEVIQRYKNNKEAGEKGGATVSKEDAAVFEQAEQELKEQGFEINILKTGDKIIKGSILEIDQTEITEDAEGVDADFTVREVSKVLRPEIQKDGKQTQRGEVDVTVRPKTIEELESDIEAENRVRKMREKMGQDTSLEDQQIKKIEARIQELKTKEDAIQEPSTESVDVQESPRDSQEVGEGDVRTVTETQEAETKIKTKAEETKQKKIDEGVDILADIFGTKPTPRKQVDERKKDIDNARKSLSKVAPEVEIVVHETDAEYRKATGEQNRSQSTRGSYNPTTKTIDINLSKAADTTVAHETFHALLLKSGINNKQAEAITSKMLASVKKVASPELLKRIEEFSNKYDTPLQSEESIAELFGILASEYNNLPKPTQNIITRWLNRLAKLLGLKSFTDVEVIDLLNTVSGKVRRGEVITEEDITILQDTKGKTTTQTRKQIVGEKAALDSSIKKDLKLAKELPGMVYSAENVKRMTGWEKGADGKWRYEIIDGEVKLPLKNGVSKLKDVYDSDILFKLYPQLKSIPVDIDIREAGRASAWYIPSENSIEINAKPHSNITSFLVHEIQHAIQFIEMFAEGGNEQIAYKAYMDTVTKEEIKKEEDLQEEIKVLGDISTVLEMAMYDFTDISVDEVLSLDFMLSNIDELGLNDKADVININTYLTVTNPKVKEEIKKAAREYGEESLEDAMGFAMMQQQDKRKEYSDMYSAYGLYQRLAGEVEARNVEERRFMSPKKRKETLLRETEDVARENQLLYTTPQTRKQMDAPNGQPSNLNEEQYKLVRTPEFKKWFGDWETDPANASKVVDENGEPMVVYHGSAAPDIEVFDRVKSGRKSSGLKEMGIYFSTNPELSNIYAQSERSKDYNREVSKEISQLNQALGEVRNNRDYNAITKRIELLEKGKVYPVFLNIRDMVTFDGKFDSNIEAWNNLKVKASYKTATGRDAMEFLSPQISKERNLEGFGVKPVDGIKAENIVEATYSYRKGGDNVLPTVTEKVKNTKDYKDFAAKYGGDAFLLFDGQPQNIKLADGSNVTFDPQSPSIRKQMDAPMSMEQRVEQIALRYYPENGKFFSNQINHLELMAKLKPTGFRLQQNKTKNGWTIRYPNSGRIFEIRKGYQGGAKVPGVRYQDGRPTIDSVKKRAEEAGVGKESVVKYLQTLGYTQQEIDKSYEVKKVTPKKVEGVQKRKRKAGQRLMSAGKLNPRFKEMLEGNEDLNYTVENQNKAIKLAQELIKDVGIDQAYEAVKRGYIRGGAATAIEAEMLVRLNENLQQAEMSGNENDIVKAIEAFNEMTTMMMKDQTEMGQRLSMWNKIFKTSILEYNLDFVKKKYEKKYGTPLPASDAGKLQAKAEQIKKQNKKVEKLEKEKGTAQENQEISNIENEAKRETAKTVKRGGSKVKSAAIDIFSTKPTKTRKQVDNDGVAIFISVGEDIIKQYKDKGVVKEAELKKLIAKGVKDIKAQLKEKGIKLPVKSSELTKKFNEAVREEIKTLKVSKPQDIEQGRIKIPKQLLYDLVLGGVKDINTLTNKVYEVIEKDYTDLTLREVRDAITGYGKEISETKDEIKEKIASLKMDGRQLSKLEDLDKGKRPRILRRRREYTQEQRKRIREIRQRLKALPLEETADLEKFYKSALESYKTRLSNRLADLNKAIEENKAIPKKESKLKLDKEAQQLKEQVKEVQKEYDAIFKDTKKSKQRTIDQIVDQKNRRLADLRQGLAYLKEKGKEREVKKTEQITSPEIENLNKQIKAVQEEYQALVEAQGIAEAKQIENAKKYIQSQIKEYQERIKNKDFSTPKKRVIPKTTKELSRERIKLKKLKNEFADEVERAEKKQQKLLGKTGSFIYETVNLGKGLLASIDFSAAGRQGIFLGSSNPKEYARAFKEMHKAVSEEKYNEFMDRLEQSEYYPLMLDMGLSITDTSGKVNQSEERFLGNWLKSRVEIKGKNVNVLEMGLKASERAYSTFLNSLRSEVAIKGIKMLEARGMTFESNPEQYKALAKFINNATGRGELTSSEGVNKLLNTIFFSPRMLVGNAMIYGQMIDPRTPGFVRKQAAKTLLTYVGYQLLMKVLLGTAMKGLIGAFGDDDDWDDVELFNWNILDTDFNKILWGDTRYDASAGQGIMMRTVARLIMGMDAEGEEDRGTTLLRFLRNKMAPGPGLLLSVINQKNPANPFEDIEDATAYDYIKSLAIPLTISGFIEDYQTISGDKKELSAAKTLFNFILNTYGVNSMTYQTKKDRSFKKATKKKIKKLKKKRAKKI